MEIFPLLRARPISGAIASQESTPEKAFDGLDPISMRRSQTLACASAVLYLKWAGRTWKKAKQRRQHRSGLNSVALLALFELQRQGCLSSVNASIRVHLSFQAAAVL